ncbi:uncharacterized protein Dwil_GK17920 [Drosophila willistoni]|uniref:Ionotropic glutamate receptor C-terminal domain-containing protein n=1 Tax=Drosophila willistoni TaxID=7260 RepID=B4N5Q4_DROWI|nr:uncharacterized protein LOC6646255 [Drosophila willistoni]EDW79693.2 uncharacterized protein Dwil_GK17920 [Drosophila willistoni]
MLVVRFVASLFVLKLFSSHLISVVNQLNQDLDIKTIIYYGYTKEMLNKLSTNINQGQFQLLLQQNLSEEFGNRQDEPVLIITELSEDLQINQLIAANLQKYFKDRQFNDILLIDWLNGTDYAEVLQLYWLAGFPHVIAYNSTESQLWSMEGYGSRRIEPTSVEKYLKQRYRGNLMGHPVRVLVTNDPPHSFVVESTEISKDPYQGSVINVFKLFAFHYNATFQAVHFAGLVRYSTWECLALVESNQIDACGSIFVKNFRFASSHPVRMNRVAIMAPYGNAIDKFYYFLRPFDDYVWIGIGGSVIYIAMMASLMHRLFYGYWNVGQYILLAIQSLLSITMRLPRPLSRSSKLYLLLLLFTTGFVLSSLYVALLSMMLTTKLYHKQMNTLADLKAANVNILFQQHNIEANSVYGGSAELRERFQFVDELVHKQHRDALDPHYAYVDSEDRMDYYLYQEKFLRRPRMKKLPNPIGYTWAVQVFKQNWPLERLYNQHIQRLFETGLQYKLVHNVHELAVRSGFLHFLPTQYKSVEPLELEDIAMAGMVLSGGYIVSGICFLGELMLGH